MSKKTIYGWTQVRSFGYISLNHNIVAELSDSDVFYRYAIFHQIRSLSLADRYTAVKALSCVPSPQAVPEILIRLNDPAEHIYVQMEAAAHLARRGVPEGTTFIQNATQSEYLEHRLEAVIILSEIHTAMSRSLLRETLADSEQHAEIRAAAAWSLGELCHGDAAKR